MPGGRGIFASSSALERQSTIPTDNNIACLNSAYHVHCTAKLFVSVARNVTVNKKGGATRNNTTQFKLLHLS